MNAQRCVEGEIKDLAQVQKSISKLDKSVGPSGAPRRRYRTIWISDVHLGTRGCNDRLLIDFLDHVDSETLYLVGDMIDGWRMKKRYYWPERHNAIVRRIMKRAKRGTEVVYIPGNHDEMFRQFAGHELRRRPHSQQGHPHHRGRTPPADPARRRVRHGGHGPQVARLRGDARTNS
jgi:predicted MPP superfamily phosphohydrolase